MDQAASGSKVSQCITIMFTIIQISIACKSTRPPRQATSTTAPHKHPLDWHHITQESDIEYKGGGQKITFAVTQWSNLTC